MSKCYILGAGFSKAVAKLPVMKELVPTFTRIHEEQRKLGHRNRVHWGEQLLCYLDFLEDEFFRKPCVRAEKGGSYEKCNFKENLEALVSFIDLNLSGTIRATLIDEQCRRSDFSKNSLFWNYSDLDELRRCIQTYIYLALIGPFPESCLLRLFIERLKPGDTLMSFNYDLVVETALYNRRLWNPSDGYGIEFKNCQQVSESHKFSTRIPLYKLHGSLNWDHSGLQLRFLYDDGTPIFPGYLQKQPPLRRPYEGKHAGNWMMPSFIKEFSAPGLLTVWTKAFKAIKQAKEVVAVGYSLPKEDSAACLLLGTSGISDKHLTLVNPQAKNLRERYTLVTGNTQIALSGGLEEYLKA